MPWYIATGLSVLGVALVIMFFVAVVYRSARALAGCVALIITAVGLSAVLIYIIVRVFGPLGA